MKRCLSLFLALLMLLSSVPTTVMATGEGASASLTGTETTVKLSISLAGYGFADTVAVKIYADKPLTLDTQNSEWEMNGNLSDINTVDEKSWNAIWGASAPADINRKVLTLSFLSKNGSHVVEPDENGGNVKLEFPVEKVTLPETLELDISKQTKVQLDAVIEPGYTTDAISWTSSDNTIATVSDAGMVTAVGIGTARITLTAGEKSAVCNVNVLCGHQGVTEVRGEKEPTCVKPGYTGDT